jgi:hypothetical protein
MQITKEYIQTQIDSIKKQQEQNLANANACIGAIQVYEQQLAYLDIPEPTPEPNAS